MTMRILIIALLFTSNLLTAQDYWKSTENSDFRNDMEASSYATYELSYEPLQDFLASAPEENLQGKQSYILVDLPLENGTLETFRIWEYAAMEPAIRAKYSHFKTYRGYSVADRTTTARIDFTSAGFHGVITKDGRTIYIDPIEAERGHHYVAFDMGSTPYGVFDLADCGVEHDRLPQKEVSGSRNPEAEKIPLRTYRTAISCTGEWGRLKGSVEDAMAHIITSANRLNEIFENELAIRLVIIDRNEEILNFDPDEDPFNDTSNGGAMLSVNTTFINSVIGANTYDLGHVYARPCNVGGIASLGSMCNFNKAAGVTCHYAGLSRMVGVTAHEIGHQMTAQHTFNNCNGNESPGNAFEPGSGTTLMSYSGLCGSQNVVNNEGDSYFHSSSLGQIYEHTRDGIANNCGTKIATLNEEPIITLPAHFEERLSIPTKTAFILEGSATDVNGDTLTYSWEQMNTGPQSDLGDPIDNAPRFRCWAPNEKSHRVIPREANLMANVGDRTEVLPSTEELLLKFHFIVRDNNHQAGTAVWEEVEFFTVPPEEEGDYFEITSFNSPQNLNPGEKYAITWNVSNTADSEINCQSFDLLYSSSSSNFFDFKEMELIASGIPNTGSFEFYMPPKITNVGRFFLRATDNIFFDLNDVNLRIVEPTEPTLATRAIPYIQDVCLPSLPTVTIETYAFAGLEGTVRSEVISDLPEGVTYEFAEDSVPVGTENKLLLDFDNLDINEYIEVEIMSIIENVDTTITSFYMNVVNSDQSSIAGETPAVNEAGVTVNTPFVWTGSRNAETYDLLVGTSPSFDPSTLIIEEYGLTDTFYQYPDILKKNTVYYWTVKGNNYCRDGKFMHTYAFSTEVLECELFEGEDLPKFISQSSTPVVTVPIDVERSGSLADVNVTLLEIDHERNKDLEVALISPAGTVVTLFENICLQRDVRCGFDDSSPTPVQCPLNSGLTYAPQELLASFNGESPTGTWTLQVNDNNPGNGGEVENFLLELCSNTTVDGPYLVNNNPLLLPPDETWNLYSNYLRIDDNNNSWEEITITLTRIPEFGQLKFDGTTMLVGDTFTQAELNQGSVSYSSPEGVLGTTQFSFTASDGEGGFLGITDFLIDVDSNHPSSVNELPQEKVNVYPNPASEIINLEFQDLDGVKTIQLYDFTGALIRTKNTQENKVSLQVQDLPSGHYYLNIDHSDGSINRKISIINK